MKDAPRTVSIQPAQPPTLDEPPSGDFAWRVREHLDAQAMIIEREANRILANTTAEAVHGLRVAARRTRSVLRILDSSMIDLRTELKWIAGVAGHTRDLDVQLAHSARQPDAPSQAVADYDARLRCDRRLAAKRLRREIGSPRFAALIASLHHIANTLPPLDQTVEAALLEHVQRALKRVKRRGRAIDGDSDIEALHRLRVSVKRLRYLLGVFEPEYGARLQRFSKGARRLQDLLGRVHDEDVGIRFLHRYADQLPIDGHRGDLIDVGRAVRDHELALVALRKRFPKAWRRLDRRCTRKALRAHIARAGVKPRRAPRHPRQATS